VSQVVFLRHLARQAPRVAFSRLLRGPGRPTWSYRFELFTTALRHTALELTRLSWRDQRVAFDALAAPSPRVFRQVKRERTDAFGVPATWFSPHAALGPGARGTTVLYLHGGGYVFGSARSHAEVIARIALLSSARALAPEYRLAPEHPFPAAVDDAVGVYEKLLAGGVDPKRVVVAGDSAGGGLTLALLLRLRDAGAPLPAGAALLCPWVDLTAKGGSLVENAPYDWTSEAAGRRWVRAYVDREDPGHPFVSPYFADLSGLPPLFVQVGGAELIRDQVTALAARAKDHGADVRLVVEPDMVHNWQTFAWFAHCRGALEGIASFVRDVTS
jgi:acetyl esterase/lipase